MPKEVLHLKELTGMSPSNGGGGRPIKVSGIRANAPDNVISQEYDDEIMTDVSTLVATDMNVFGSTHTISVDKDNKLKVDYNETGLKSDKECNISCSGNMVSILDSSAKIVTFTPNDIDSYIIEKPEWICEEDVISAPTSTGHFTRLIQINDDMAIGLMSGANRLCIVFLNDVAGNVNKSKGDIIYTDYLTSGKIYDFALSMRYNNITTLEYIDIYYIYKSYATTVVSKQDLAGCFTDITDATTFTVATFEALVDNGVGVIIDTDSLPSNCEPRSIVVTATKIFIAYRPIGVGDAPALIKHTGGSYTYEVQETEDLLFSFTKSLLDYLTDTFVYAETFDALEATGDTDTSLHRSMLPFMPYKFETIDQNNGPSHDTSIAASSPIQTPYGFDEFPALATAMMGLKGKKWYPVGTADNSSQEFVMQSPAGLGLAASQVGDSVGVYLTGELILLGYSTDTVGYVVVTDEDAFSPKHVDVAATYPLAGGAGSIPVTMVDKKTRLIWGNYDGMGYFSQMYSQGRFPAGIGGLSIALVYDEDDHSPKCEKVQVRSACDWPYYSHSNNANKMFLYTWSGIQPINADLSAYAGITYSEGTRKQANNSGQFLPLASEETAYVNAGGGTTHVTYPGLSSYAMTSWVHESASPLNFIYPFEWTTKKHFDITVTPSYAYEATNPVFLPETGACRGCARVTFDTTDTTLLETIFSDVHISNCMRDFTTGPTTFYDRHILSGSVSPLASISRADFPYLPSPPDVAGEATLKFATNTATTPDEPSEIKAYQAIASPTRTTADMSFMETDNTLNTYAFTYYDGILLDDTAGSEVAALSAILTGEVNADSGSALATTSVRYKYSFTYDGLHEGPLSTFTVLATALPDNARYKVDLTINIPSNIAAAVSKRITHINIWGAELAGDSEVELYKLVTSLKLVKRVFATATDGYTASFTDQGVRGPTFESIAGYNETQEKSTVKRNCQCHANGYLFVGDVNVEDRTTKAYTGNIVVRSAPGQVSVFDYSNDFAVIPFTPVVMRGHNNRLYVFGATKYAVVNPETLGVEYVSDIIGCANEHNIVADEFGLFVYYKNRIYSVDNAEVVEISAPIASSQVTPLITLEDNDGGAAWTWLAFLQSRRSLVAVFHDASNDTHIFLYNIDTHKWFYYPIAAALLDVVSIYVLNHSEQYEEENVLCVVCDGVRSDTYDRADMFQATTKRAFSIDYILDMFDTRYGALVYDIEAYSNVTEQTVSFSLDGTGVFMPSTTGNQVNKSKLTVSRASGTTVNDIDDIRLVVRRKP